MPIRCAARALAVLVGLAVATCGTGAAVVQGQPEESGRAALVAVTDARGRAVVDLDADDFVVVESGERREVLTVYVAEYPVGVVIDNSTGAAPHLPLIRSAAARLIARMGVRPVAVGTLTDPERVVAGPGDDRGVVLDRIGRIEPSEAAPVPAAATANVVSAITAVMPPFSAVIVISAAAVAYENPAAGVIKSIFNSRTTVHVVALRAAGAGTGDAPDVLRELARQTRGQYTPIYSPVSYPAALDGVADRLASEIVVEYLSRWAGRPSGAADETRIGVQSPGLSVIGLGIGGW
jgi:hypothetical protein